ncbi:MAG: J domain-containing protein [Methylococcales bacterium]
MKNTQSYKSHYQTLNVKFDCNWKELRSGYKKAIQKWHPDRFEDGSEQKSAANEKIKNINIAYNHINSYYRKNGNLPIIDINPTNRIRTKETPTGTKQEPINKKQQHKPKTPTHRSQNKSSNYLKFFIMTVSIGAYIYFSSDFDESSDRHESIRVDDTNLSNIPIKVKNNNHIENLHSSNKKPSTSKIKTSFFRIGSTIGDVISAQGLPRKTDGDIWFYGDSEIHFKQGKVSHWVRSKNTPLNIRLK